MWNKLLFAITIIWITSSTNAATLTCQWFGDVCNIVNITTVTTPNEAIIVAGKPANYINTATILFQINSEGFANYFPTKVLSIFTAITTVRVYNAKLALVTDSFASCSKLNNIQIYYGSILTVPEGFAQTCLLLTSVNLMSNGIQSIDPNALRGLTNLASLDLRTNEITCIPTDLFRATPNIKKIFLSSNKISSIDPNVFRSLPLLVTIDMSYNLLENFPLFNLTGTGYSFGLTTFLDGNPIYAIKPDICSLLATRPVNTTDTISVLKIPCVTNSATISLINKINCYSLASAIQGCYASWKPLMSIVPPCGQSIFCIPTSLWPQIAELLKGFGF